MEAREHVSICTCYQIRQNIWFQQAPRISFTFCHICQCLLTTSDIIISHTPGWVNIKLLIPSWREFSLSASVHNWASRAAGGVSLIALQSRCVGWVVFISWGETTSRVGFGGTCFSKHWEFQSADALIALRAVGQGCSRSCYWAKERSIAALLRVI